MEEKIICIWCGSDAVYKKGTRKSRVGTKQIYFCKSCNQKFTDGKIIDSPIAQGPKAPRLTYAQHWHSYNQAQTSEKKLIKG